MIGSRRKRRPSTRSGAAGASLLLAILLGFSGWGLLHPFRTAATSGMVQGESAADSVSVSPDDWRLDLVEPRQLPVGAAIPSFTLSLEYVGSGEANEVTLLVQGLIIDGESESRPHELSAEAGTLTLSAADFGAEKISSSREGISIRVLQADSGAEIRPVSISAWWRVLPPVLAIVLAIVIREVNIALVLATFSGCLVYSGWSQPFAALNDFCHVMTSQLADYDHASVILFTVLLGAMIGLMNDGGGTAAVVSQMARFANTRRRGQVLTWLMGLVVFFDDYANTLLIGGAMRPLSDRLRISRAKLAFLIDSTAAPIAGLVISTWVGFEIGQIDAGLQTAGIDGDAGSIFWATIPYRAYPLLAILFVGVIAVSGRDFGPMLRMERSALESLPGETVATANVGSSRLIWLAVVPVATLVGLVMYFWWIDVDPFRMLLLASLLATTVAFLLNLISRRMTFERCCKSLVDGMTSMVPAVIVLVLAWAVSDVCRDGRLDTAGFIVDLVGRSISPALLPSIAFLVAGAIAVSVGSSFATMGLLIPLFIPLCWGILDGRGMELSVESPIFLGTVGAILAGAIFGDHCSPISDTTVLSSAAAGCNHLHHVTTQMPYALLIAVFSVLFVYLPIGMGAPWWLMLPLAAAGLCGAVLFLGTNPETREASASSKSAD